MSGDWIKSVGLCYPPHMCCQLKASPLLGRFQLSVRTRLSRSLQPTSDKRAPEIRSPAWQKKRTNNINSFLISFRSTVNILYGSKLTVWYKTPSSEENNNNIYVAVMLASLQHKVLCILNQCFIVTGHGLGYGSRTSVFAFRPRSALGPSQQPSEVLSSDKMGRNVKLIIYLLNFQSQECVKLCSF